jgi:Uma2 family endonuclease
MGKAARRIDMTVEEFLQWNLFQDERHELVDGVPVPLRAMAGTTAEHDTITVNIIVALGQQLRNSSRKPRTADTAVRTKIKRVRCPDVTIECGGLELGALEARNPIAAFEVLSPTTRRLDRSVKLQEYLKHPTLRVIVHIDPLEMDVLVYTRNTDGTWDDTRLEYADDVLRVPETPVALSLATIYEGVPVVRLPRLNEAE